MISFQRLVLYIQFDAEWFSIHASHQSSPYMDAPYLAVDTAHRVAAIGLAAQQLVAQGGSSYQLVAPFSHPRLWLSNYTAAAALITYSLRRMKLPYPRLRPHIIVHPRRLLCNDLTHIELMASYDLALNLQAKHVYVWLGRDLTEHEYRTLQFPTAEGRVFTHPEHVNTVSTTL